ncbi:MAG: flagellar filament capping protein FliD, partial [Nitrospinaceae bacterium]
NLEKNRVQEISLTSAVKNLKSGMTIPFKNTGRDLLERLTSIGIRTGEDNFFKVDATQLDRALHINPGEVLDLFENPETGILPNLESQLSRILDENLGDLALKQQESAIFSQTPDQLAEKFRRFQESSTFGEKVQKLIVVI